MQPGKKAKRKTKRGKKWHARAPAAKKYFRRLDASRFCRNLSLFLSLSNIVRFRFSVAEDGGARSRGFIPG